jgi:hypothetical protein
MSIPTLRPTGRVPRTLWAALAALLTCLCQGTALAQIPPPFVHPGVLVDLPHLKYIRTQIEIGTEPFASAFAVAQKSRWGALSYAVQGPPANGVIVCGADSADLGCTQEDSDASAAYTQALLWTLTGDNRYAQKAIQIMNHYARTLRAHRGDNAPLQAAWAAEKWPAAAEIMRYSDAGWDDQDFAAFAAMLRQQYLPLITGDHGAGKNGNWTLSMIDGALGIAVVTDDHDLFDASLARWNRWVPAYFYNFALDGAQPVLLPEGPADWNGQTHFDAQTSGVTQETCRDLHHAQLGLAATFNAAETAYLQGVDLYTPMTARLTTSLEYTSRLLAGVRQTELKPAPAQSENDEVADLVPQTVLPEGFAGLCDGQHYRPILKATMERAYNAYSMRQHVALPYTQQHLQHDVRPFAPPDDQHNVMWETLTHGTLIHAASTGTMSPAGELSGTRPHLP